jgi:hypothetical protein
MQRLSQPFRSAEQRATQHAFLPLVTGAARLKPSHAARGAYHRSAADASSQQPHVRRWSSAAVLSCAAACCASLMHADPVQAIQMEPANALSLPTWAIHVSSVVRGWQVHAMLLILLRHAAHRTQCSIEAAISHV